MNKNMTSPIALFVYNRLWHTTQTVEALQKNDLACDSDLFIFSDGPKNEVDRNEIDELRSYINTIKGFRQVRLIERNTNLGLAGSIIEGVTQVVNEYGKVIVLEDDLVTSRYFLKYMNDGLDRYENEEKVVSIHGYVYPVKDRLPHTFFLKGADCWGWSTWKRGWDLFDKDGTALLKSLKQLQLTKTFDFNGTYPFTTMLENQIAGRNNSWAIRWYASAFLKGKLTLYPGRSLVCNIGNDGSGTHCGMSHDYAVNLAQEAVELMDICIEENINSRKAFEVFLKSRKESFFRRIIRKFCAV